MVNILCNYLFIYKALYIPGGASNSINDQQNSWDLELLTWRDSGLQDWDPFISTLLWFDPKVAGSNLQLCPNTWAPWSAAEGFCSFRFLDESETAKGNNNNKEPYINYVIFPLCWHTFKMDPGTKFERYIFLGPFLKTFYKNSALLIPSRWASARWVWPCLRMAAVRPLMNQPMASLERTAPGLWSWSCRARHKRRPKPCWEEGLGWVGWVGLAVRYRFWVGWVGEKRWWGWEMDFEVDGPKSFWGWDGRYTWDKEINEVVS